MSRTFTSHVVTYRARRIQDRAFLAGALFGLAFMGFALTGREPLAMACAILGAFALGVSCGAWVLGSRFRD